MKKLQALVAMICFISIFQALGNPNTYTQTEAFLRVWFRVPKEKQLTRKDLEFYSDEMMKLYGTNEVQRAVFSPLIMTMLDNEQKYKNMYVFYHAYNKYAFSYFFDTLREVYSLLTGTSENRDVPLLRDIIRMEDEWVTIFPYKNAEEFLRSDLKPSSSNTDKGSPLMDFLLSVNISIFANFGEGFGHHLYSSYAYFDYSKSLGGTGKIEDFFNYWGFDSKYEQAISQLYDSYNKISFNTLISGEMLQIFIPEHLIDALVYASEPLAFPYDRKITHTFDVSLKRHTDMLSILQLYKNDPYAIPKHIINSIQGRILLISDFFDPNNGVKIFRYNVNPESKNKEYSLKLHDIIKKMLIDWLKNSKSNEMIKKFNLDKNKIYARLGLINYEDTIAALSNDLAIIHAFI